MERCDWRHPGWEWDDDTQTYAPIHHKDEDRMKQLKVGDRFILKYDNGFIHGGSVVTVLGVDDVESTLNGDYYWIRVRDDAGYTGSEYIRVGNEPKILTS